mgnify:CR=1 FL=1
MLLSGVRVKLMLAIVALIAAGCQSSGTGQNTSDRPVTEWPSYQAITALRTSGGE